MCIHSICLIQVAGAVFVSEERATKGSFAASTFTLVESLQNRALYVMRAYINFSGVRSYNLCCVSEIKAYKKSLQLQVPLQLPCYDFASVEISVLNLFYT